MNKLSNPISVAASAAALALLAACSSAPPARDVAEAPVVSGSTIASTHGYVSRIETVPVESRQGRSGAVVGAVLGAVVGNQIGDGNGQKAAIAAGAVGGALAGNAIQNRNRRDDEVYRVTVRFDDGHEASYDFQRVDALRTGDRVKYEGGQLHRL
jgi:outer membrane lipoprotein SlyB